MNKNVLEFIELIYNLKELKRTGWVKRKFKNPESIADHSFMVTLLAYLFAKENKLNVNKCIKLALIHDLGESIIGDIVTYNKTKDFKIKKQELELKAINKLSKLTKNKELENLFKELLQNKTKESKFVHELDKLDVFIQSKIYSKRGDSDYESFKNEIKKIVTYKNIKDIIKIIDDKKE